MVFADVLEVDDVYKSYEGHPALQGVSLSVSSGEILGVVGRNGAGKTTLISIIAGLLTADAGSVRVRPRATDMQGSAGRRDVGLAPQETAVFPTATVTENLLFFAKLHCLRRPADRIDEVLRAFFLVHLADRQARLLSGGERRRLHTAIAVIHEPALLLLDEPTVGVDVETRAQLLDVVKGLASEGAAICYSTHYLQEIEQLDATVALLDEGRVVASGPSSELIAESGLTGAELVFDGDAPVLDGAGDTWIDGSVLRVFGPVPAVLAAETVARLGPHRDRLRSIELIVPNLETVYLRRTGTRFDSP